MSGRLALVLAVLLLASGCRRADPPATAATPVPPDNLAAMNEAGEAFVKLALALGQHDPDYVDAYFGPPEWRKEAEAAKKPLDTIATEGAALVSRLRAVPEPADELPRLRRSFLLRITESLVARVEMLQGKKFSFDEESKALYDAVAPVLGEEHFRGVRGELATALPPGRGALIDRYEAWRRSFTIPKAKLDAVFRAAIDECRARTAKNIELPPGESFTVEYVTGKSWSAYNWYKGDYHSVIQVNAELPITIDRAIDLACHEGYPGHHLYNSLRDKNLVRERKWIEHSVLPLFAPHGVIAEGSANFGIEVAFPGAERLAYEKATLFPLAGLDPARAEEHGRVQSIVDRLAYAQNEAARRYLNGEIEGKEAARLLSEYALMPRDRAAQRIKFFDQYRSYVINYNVGKDLARRYVESRGGTPDQPAKRWEEFERLLWYPLLPSQLAVTR